MRNKIPKRLSIFIRNLELKLENVRGRSPNLGSLKSENEFVLADLHTVTVLQCIVEDLFEIQIVDSEF